MKMAYEGVVVCPRPSASVTTSEASPSLGPRIKLHDPQPPRRVPFYDTVASYCVYFRNIYFLLYKLINTLVRFGGRIKSRQENQEVVRKFFCR
jgi:hypothetical protein